MDALSDGRDDRIVRYFRFRPVPQRRKREQHDPMVPTEVERLPFGEIGMGFDLHHSRLDSRGRNNLPQRVQGHIG